MATSPEIFDFTDFRAFLRAWLSERRGNISVRSFAREAKCSPALVSSIANGRRNLDQERATAFAKVMRLTPREAEFFHLLVAADGSRPLAERERAWSQITAIRTTRNARRVDGAELEIFFEWYYGAILEMSRCVGFSSDPEWIARRLSPRVSSSQVRKAVKRLEELGFLEARADGSLHPIDETARTTHEPGHIEGDSSFRQVALYRLHQGALDLGRQALERVPAEERQYGSTTVSIPTSMLPELKRRVQEFQDELLKLCNTPPHHPDRVYQINVQLFPVSDVTTEP